MNRKKVRVQCTNITKTRVYGVSGIENLRPKRICADIVP